MSDDTYNGWTNRETWAVKLWLDNDQGLYAMAHERVSDALARYPHDAEDKHYAAVRAGEAIKELYDELTDPDEGLMTAEQALTMVKDVGSEYRVNWQEIGEAYLSELD